MNSALARSFSIAGPRFEGFRAAARKHLAKPELLRRAVPVLIAAFAALAAVGLVAQTIQARQAALDAAEERLALMADLAALRLNHQSPADNTDWQSTLAQSLPKGATLEDRFALLADAEGKIRANVPLTAAAPANLLDILGPQQPLTTFGAEAGVLRLSLTDGTDAIVTVRNVPATDAQMALIQPIGAALAGWRRDASLEISLLICTGLVLALLGGGLWYLGPAEARGEHASSAKELNEALSASALWRWNLARGHVHWSAPMYQLLGRAPNDGAMAFREIGKALHPEDDLRRDIERHLRDGKTHFDQTVRLRHAEGHYVSLKLRGHIGRDQDTGELSLTAVASADQDLAGSPDANARLRDAVETISEAFVLWDAQNRLVMCNSKYQQFHGLPDGAIRPGTPYEEVIAAASDPVIRKRISVDGNDEGACTYEAQLEDGRWLHINERRTRDGGYVSVGTDITVLKESQQRLADSEQQLRASVAELRLSRRELEQQKQQLVDLAEKYALEKNRAEAANRAKSEFLANISHELRTPLNAVIGFSEVMQQALFGPLGHAKYQEYARDIYASGSYLLEVINDILDMSKIEAGRMTLDIGTVDVADIVEDSMKVVGQAAAERRITLSRHGPSKVMLEADRRALKQVFLNLLSNAVKFTRDGGSVDVHLSRTKDIVRVAIKDTGIGIPESDIVKLGRPFEQVENQFSKSHQGSGLGLAISRALVELHGGALRIVSHEGKGTTVTCTLPVSAVALPSEPATASA
jgi:two-component system cell cycle sensor histidine kinase PleC